MSTPTDAFEAGIQIAAALGRHKVPYALGGALAYGQYGIPRATNDVDVNVFVGPEQLDDVFNALRSLGVVVDAVAARSAAEREGLMVLWLGPFRLDVFTPSIDFAWEAARTRVRYDISGTAVWFLSAEALCVFKLLFFRGKDVVDLERLIAVQGAAIDSPYVRARIVEMLGDDDPRVATWDRLWREHGPGGGV
jgi:hypothetical protein